MADMEMDMVADVEVDKVADKKKVAVFGNILSLDKNKSLRFLFIPKVAQTYHGYSHNMLLQYLSR